MLSFNVLPLRFPIRIRDLAPRLPNNQIAGSVIPDLLFVVRSDRQPEIQIPGAAGDGSVLGFFFANDVVVGEVVFEGANDQRLGPVVADGDGGFVVFGFGAFGPVEDALGEDGGSLDGELSDVDFFLVGHG